MPNEPVFIKEPTLEEIKEFAKKHNLTFEVKDSSNKFPKKIGDGEHIVLVDLDVVEWYMVMGQVQILKLIEEFEKIHPDIKIKLKIISWSSAYKEFLKAAEGKNTPPDVLQMPSTWTAKFADMNKLEVLTQYDKEIIGFNNFYENSLLSSRINGEYYAVPWILDIRVLYYWKDILNKAGVKEEDLRNWESYEKASNKIRNKGYNALAIPGGKEGEKEWVLVQNLVPWVYGNGGKIINLEARKLEIAHPEDDAYKGLWFYINLAEYTNSSLDSNLSFQEIQNKFLNKEYAMLYSGPWLVNIALEAEEEGKINLTDIGATFPPAGNVGVFTFVGGSNLAIWDHGGPWEGRDSALDLIKFLSSNKAAQLRYAEATYSIPALVSALDDYTQSLEILKVFQKVMLAGIGISFHGIPEWAEYENILVDHLNSIWKYVGDKKLSVETHLQKRFIIS